MTATAYLPTPDRRVKGRNHRLEHHSYHDGDGLAKVVDGRVDPFLVLGGHETHQLRSEFLVELGRSWENETHHLLRSEFLVELLGLVGNCTWLIETAKMFVFAGIRACGDASIGYPANTPVDKGTSTKYRSSFRGSPSTDTLFLPTTNTISRNARNPKTSPQTLSKIQARIQKYPTKFLKISPSVAPSVMARANCSFNEARTARKPARRLFTAL